MTVWLADPDVETTPAPTRTDVRGAGPRPVTGREGGVKSAQRAAGTAPLPNIPLIDDPIRRAPDVQRPELKALPRRYTVLVVDDDPRMLDLAARFLQRENLEVLSAWSGSEALRVAGAHERPIDVLLTDYAMPKINGRQLATQLRERFPAVKVLYQTGFADLLFDKRPELEDGAAFVEKPFSARGLREALRFLLFDAMNAPESPAASTGSAAIGQRQPRTR